MTTSIRLSRAILDLLSHEFGASVIYTAMAKVCAELYETQPEKAEDIICGIWKMMIGDVSRALEKAPPGQAVAISVLDSYFSRHGDWRRIVREAGEAFAKLEPSEEEVKRFAEGVQANVKALLEVYQETPK